MTDTRALHPSSMPTSPRRTPRPTPAPVAPVNGYRVFVWTTAIAALVYGTMHLVGELSLESSLGKIVALTVGAILLPIGASPVEWFVHRFVYHETKIAPLGAIHTVHTTHHFTYFPTWRYVTNGEARRLPVSKTTTEAAESTLSNASIRLAHFSWYMAFGLVFFWIPGWLLSSDGWLVAGLVAGSITVSNLFIVVHDTIHRPGSHRIVEAQPWYRFLDNHHWVHHIDLGANLNFLLPLADLLFGTLRLKATDEEVRLHGTLEQAKMHRIGSGERARVA